MGIDPFKVVRDFEAALCDYTGAKYAVTVTSCTSAIMLALLLHDWGRPYETIGVVEVVKIPKRTYVGVAQSVLWVANLGNWDIHLRFADIKWSGCYQIGDTPVWDYARRFTSGMYRPGEFQCVSFHPTKILGLSGYGGAILHDSDDADEWLRRARFDGRKEGVHPKDDVFTRGWHCYMAPATAAEGLVRLASLPEHNDDLPNDDYSDLSTQEIFR